MSKTHRRPRLASSKKVNQSARVALGLLALLLLTSRDAHAVEDELTIGLGPGYTDLRLSLEGQSGFGGGMWAEYRLTDYWGITSGAFASYQISDGEQELPGQTIYHGWLGALYTIDITTFVPFLSLAATWYVGDPALQDAEDMSVDAGLKLGIGMDYRRYRYFSVGVEANLHAFFTDVANYPVFVTTLVRFNYHYEF